MQKRLQIATLTMANLSAISFLFTLALTTILLTTPLSAQSITPTSDEYGRKIYVNVDHSSSKGSSGFSAAGSGSAGPSSSSSSSSSSPRGLVYWSVTEHRFKPVPTSGAVMRAARSAASEVNTYLDGRAQTHETLNRAFTQEDIDVAIDQAAARHNVDPSLVRSVVKVESNFNPNAVSRKGAMGLMQLMPSTARSLNVVNPFDPAQNVEAGVKHLRALLDNYRGNVSLSLAAYNAGSAAVSRSAGVPHYRETQNYVRRITSLYNSGDPGSYSMGSSLREPVRVQRDARGVLFISNTE
ncbi:MAG TPA: lytic transglycosylase domain-containing protein [Terriglobales bacterium]|nr:lytic transglycosylase domain-containing protein [Terriglobales bacterium]